MNRPTTLSELVALFDLRPVRTDRYGATADDDMAYARAVGAMLVNVSDNLNRLQKFQRYEKLRVAR